VRTIIVLGMHRSGTSAIARALGRLGAETGAPDQLGHLVEHRGLRSVNRQLISRAGGTWDGPPPGAHWLDDPHLERFDARAAEAMRAAFEDADVVVWKDPRTCLTLPRWLPHLGDRPVAVIIHRHPVEVAASLEVRNRMGASLSFAVWERYNAEALRHAAGLPAFVVEYSQTVNEPRESIVALAEALATWGVTLPNDPRTTDVGLVATGRHHQADLVDRFDHPDATPSQLALFEHLRRLGGAHDLLIPPAPAPEPSQASVDLMRRAARRRLERRTPSRPHPVR